MISGSWQDSCPNIPAAFSYMRRKEIFVDVVFKRDKVPCFYAHKLVMSLWSPHLADLMQQSNKQSVLSISFTEDVDVMEEILDYLYSTQGNDNFCSRMPVRKLIQALEITERLCIRQLHQRYLKSLQRKKIDSTNVITFFDYGLKRNVESVVRKCVKNLRVEGVSQDKLDDTISADTIEALLKMDRIAVESEAILLNIAVSWLSHSRNKCYKSDVLSLVDLSSIEWKEYQHVVNKFPGFFSDAELSSIFLAVARPDVCLFPDWYNPRISTTVENDCDTCLTVRKRLTIPSCNHMKYPSDVKDIVQSFDFSFKISEKASLINLELSFGPGDIDESEFTVKFRKSAIGQWRECLLNCSQRRNKYTVIFQEPLKLKIKDSLYLRFFFSRSLRESEIKFVIPNIIERQLVNDRLKGGCVAVELKMSKLAFYCGVREDPKFLLSSFCLRFCDRHLTCLVRRPVNPKFRSPQCKSDIAKTELMDTSMIKKEMCID